MHHEPATPPCPAESASRTEPDAPRLWAAMILADPEPALLARVVQKLMTQTDALDRLRYESDELRGTVRIEVLFRAAPDRAQLLARRWETLIAVRAVTLCPALVSRERSSPRLRAA